MTRRVVAVAVVATMVLAGCLGGPTNVQSSDQSPTPAVTGDDVPGVANGSLTNVSALARANEGALTETGGEIQVRRTVRGNTTGYRLRLDAGLSTYLLNGTYPGGGQPVAVALWANETAQVLRTESNGEERYRVMQRDHQVPNALALVESYVAGGQFTVQNASTGDGTVVLTADEYVAPGAGESAFTNVSAYNASLVVDDAGRIQEFTISAVADGRPVTYHYELRTTGIEQVTRPGWLSDVPASASLQANVEITVENESYLGIEHRGGDSVPPGSTLELTTNGTTLTTTVSTQLAAGDSLYAYRDATDGSLQLSEDRPASDRVMPLTSPVSVTLATADGTTLVNAGMGWDSSSASAGEGAGGSASEESTG